MSSEANTRRIAVAVAIVLLAAAAFWLLLLSPKRKEADEWATRAETQQLTLSEAQSKAAEASAARKTFPKNYREMILLGKAVPEGDETAALIVQIADIAHRTHVRFGNLTLESGGEATASATAQEAGPTTTPTPIPPTEAEAALLPLGATLGSSDLAVMPYTLDLTGNYSQVTEFVGSVERLIKTHERGLSVDGRLLTLNAFSLSPAAEKKHGKELLAVEMRLTAYLAPPAAESPEAGLEAAGVEAGAPEATTEGETTTASPSSFSTGEAR